MRTHNFLSEKSEKNTVYIILYHVLGGGRYFAAKKVFTTRLWGQAWK